MKINFSGEYKSLKSFVWEEIPKLVVITGPNGSGKTQLLELIHESITNAKPHDWNCNIQEPAYTFDEVVYLKGDWGVVNIPAIDIATIQGQHKSLFNTAFSNFDRPKINNTSNTSNYRETEGKKIEYDNFARSLGKTARYLVTYEEFSSRYPKNHLNVDVPINRQINNVFFNYRIAQVEAASNGLSQDEIVREIGQPPWTVLREIIHISKLPFEINDPADCSLWDNFELKLVHAVTKQQIKFVDLSSGEKILLSLIFYLYQSQERQIFPKLLLMDEPDAHLHPSMAQQFLNVVKDVLVGKFDIQVIMTTHSPSTVVLTPEQSLFEMSINEPRIKPSPSKNHSVALLTSGLVYVGDGTKYFLVEDHADVDFYNYVYNKLIGEYKITADIPLVFIKASTSESSGGKATVSSWVEKLRKSGLTGIIHGLIDKDSGNTAGDGIFTIKRYSIENYLIDPLVIYAALMEAGLAFPVDQVNFSMGEEYRLKALPQETLQKITDEICAKISPKLSEHLATFKTDFEQVVFTETITLSYPKWLLDSPGKTIINSVCNQLFGSKINQGNLLKAFKRLNMVPNDLVEKLHELQKAV
jgi:energy-coupling factor transporter ATP-binding protein EcfA2